ncbi:MAG: methyltransferase domain-containing protein, partial [Alphaproteobacteria bacterium]|nr:methyltransferase domain-containing protein [Alphaproteobacteria bacterium]
MPIGPWLQAREHAAPAFPPRGSHVRPRKASRRRWSYPMLPCLVPGIRVATYIPWQGHYPVGSKVKRQRFIHHRKRFRAKKGPLRERSIRMERHEYELMARLEDRMWWYRALHAQIADACRGLELPSEATVLDAGCGTGGLLKRLAQFRPSWHLRGVEWDGEACAWAKRKLERGTILQGSVHHLPFAEGVFDLVISADVLCHANVDPGRALNEMRRVLKPGGRFIMSLPAYQWMLSAHDIQVHNA